MNEIEKLYELAGVKPKYSGWLDMGDLDMQMQYIQCDTKEEWKDYCFMSRSGYSSDNKNWDKPIMDYPPFTAEKQLELIKFILGKGVYYDTDKNYKEFWFHYTDDIENVDYKPFEEAICEFINVIWQGLTEIEQAEIRKILEG